MKSAQTDPPPPVSFSRNFCSRTFYNLILVPVFYIAAHILALFNHKIRTGIVGRKNLFVNLQKNLARLHDKKSAILIHAASMGEYEQARPIIRLLRQKFPDLAVIASVFSPSAYENIQNKTEADILTYLPFDSRPAVGRFLDMLRPQIFLIIRHDIWPNLLWEARQRGIYSVLVDASVHDGSMRHKMGIRQFYRALFRNFVAICPISDSALQKMKKFIPETTQSFVFGDTRFDQVVFRAKEKPVQDLLPPAVFKWPKIWIAGSTWPEDDAVVLPAFADLKQVADVRLILVPHEPTESHLKECEALCRQFHLPVQRLSEFREPDKIEVLLIDQIGILANLYAAAQVAFIGGSFGPGVHSVIEAAAHGLPVLFGPKIGNSAEALEMVDEGCGFMIQNTRECAQYLKSWFQDPEALHKISEKAEQFVAGRTGASDRIVRLIESMLVLKQPGQS